MHPASAEPSTRTLRRRIVSLAIPALGTLAVEPLYVLVDTAIVGRLGTAQLAGLAIASTILLTTVSIASALEYGLTPAVAFANGSGDTAEARAASADGVHLAALAGIPLAVALAALARPLCWLLGGRGEVLHHASTYLRIAAVGLPFILLAYVGHGVMRGLNSLRLPLVIVLVGNVVNLVLEVVAVYVLKWGVAGSAASTVVAQVAVAAAFLVVLSPHTARVRPRWRRLRPMLVIGGHFAVRSLAMYAVWNSATLIAARVDTPTLAAHQVLTQMFMFLALALDALAIPAQSLVAGALGATRPTEAMRIGALCTRLSLWCGLGVAVVLAVGSPWISRVFSEDVAVHDRLILGLLILAVMQLPGAVAFALDGALIGAADQQWLARQAILNTIGFVPLAVATLIRPSLGMVGLWGAQLAWMILRAYVNGRRWNSLGAAGFAGRLGRPADQPGHEPGDEAGQVSAAPA